MSGGGVDMIAGAVVQRVAGILGNYAWERIELLWNFKEDAQEMEKKMIDLKVALNYADKRSREAVDEVVQHWLKKYKSAAYLIEDTLDELETDAMIWKTGPSKAKLFFTSINPLIVRITMSNKMRNIRVKLDKIAEDKKKLPDLPLPTSTDQGSNGKWRATFIGDRHEIELVGREREKKDILRKVLQKDGDHECSIITVVGLGGIGKTAIAKYVYSVKESNIFDVKAWVHVSTNFDLKKIAADVISQVEDTVIADDATLQFLKSHLDRILCEKLYLIVLDDLWEEGRYNLEALMNMLQSGKKGSKIIVTTRSEKVAHTLCTIYSSHFHTVQPIRLEGLSTDECWSIMKPYNRGIGDELTELVGLGKEIAEKCSGVPLVAKALGHVMNKYCTSKEWLEIKNSNILSIKNDDSGILKGLLLSYYHMPPQLKLCFMYCSIFPKSHEIDHDCLIQQWIALGFIQDSDGQPLQRTGTQYVEEFLGMSFLTVLTSLTVPAARIFKPTLRLRMHDMVHDLARHVAGDEFCYTNGETNKYTKRDKLDCHYQLLMNQNKVLLNYKDFPIKVKALHFRGCDNVHLPDKAFSHTLCLRVLDLSECRLSELPSSISKLKFLRYLDASNLSIICLPKSFNYLLNLQTLILSNTCLTTLPMDIGCLQKLQYFDISGCANLTDIPTSLGNLSDLLFLNMAKCHELHTLPESFGKLQRLQFLNLSDCYKLHSLPESCCQLQDLTHLDLSDCHNLGKLPDCIGNLSNLEYLNLTSCSKIPMLPESLCKLGMLKHLNLSYCLKLENLPSSIGELRLQYLDISGCSCLIILPDGIFNMSTLQNVAAEVGQDSVMHQVEIIKDNLGLTRSNELNIQVLENVKHLPVQIKPSNNLRLTKLIIVWKHDEDSLAEPADATAEESMLEMLMPPRSLQHLILINYMGNDLPRWMLDAPSYLPYLTTVRLDGLTWCKRVPPLGFLPNLRSLQLVRMPNIKRVGREFYGDYGSCQKLRIILLHSMENLEGWWTTRSSIEDGEFLIPYLHLLHCVDCPKLKFLPYPPRSSIWLINNSDHVLPEHGFGNLSSTTSSYILEIDGTFPSSQVWHRAQYLSPLDQLILNTIAGLRTLPDAIQCFTSLRILRIQNCHNLKTLPEWLGDLTSLREIFIESCPRLSSLPESIIKRLTELRRLEITNCPTLIEKCRGDTCTRSLIVPHGFALAMYNLLSTLKRAGSWKAAAQVFFHNYILLVHECCLHSGIAKLSQAIMP